jgi:GDP-L-fucose synthase
MSKTRIFIAGHNGMVGSALVRALQKQDVELILKERKELNLLNQQDVQNFFKYQKIDQVYLAAARVGGIYANNTYPAEFIYENLLTQINVIHSAFANNVKKLLFLGSSCVYPKNAKQPIKEEYLLNGKLEETNEAYAVAKIAGIKMCESYNRQYGKSHNIDYRSIMPTNLYGPGDNYHVKNSHVIPSLIYRFHKAKINKLSNVTIWGTGIPKREFLHVDDMVSAAILIMGIDKKIYYKNKPSVSSCVNVGSSEDLTIKKLAEIIKEVVGFKGKIYFDPSKPDGVDRKFLNSNLAKKFGFKAKISLRDGLIKTYQDYIKVECKF